MSRALSLSSRGVMGVDGAVSYFPSSCFDDTGPIVPPNVSHPDPLPTFSVGTIRLAGAEPSPPGSEPA